MANRFLISTMQRYNHSLVYPYFAKAISKIFFSGGWGESITYILAPKTTPLLG